MFSNVERTRLLSTAIPTGFGSNIETWIETTAHGSENSQTIDDNSLTDEIIVTSTHLNQVLLLVSIKFRYRHYSMNYIWLKLHYYNVTYNVSYIISMDFNLVILLCLY